MQKPTVGVIGTGYVGLVTGACLAESGANVTCMDIDEAKINKLREGTIPIYEPGLSDVVLLNHKNKRLSFTTKLKEVAKADIIFLALPTPPGEDGSADLSYVLKVAKGIGQHLTHYTVIVNKSTVPVGTAQLVRDNIVSTEQYDVVSNPEFLREGHAVEDFMKPDRIVIGTSSDRAFDLMAELYKPFKDAKMIRMDEASSEMTKYAANSFLALKVSFINEIANLCDAIGANVDNVVAGIGSDPRISPHFLRPGIGFGGSCFPKDVLALQQTAKAVGAPLRTLDAIVDINTAQKTRLVTKLREHFGDLSGKHFAVWGLAFKPDTDDIRESPALEMIDQLLTLGATVTAYDPQAMDNVRKRGLREGFDLADDKYVALNSADALLIATEWDDFNNVDLSIIENKLQSNKIFDGRNIYSRGLFDELGIHYYGIGR